MKRINLLRTASLRGLLQNRWPQFLARAVLLGGFLFTILAGLWGPAAGSHNFAIIMVWIAWWTALKLGFIPLGGRSWCSVCPIPMPGEWLQNRGVLTPRKKGALPARQWPRLLRGSWLQAGGFLMVGLFGAVTLTSAGVTALVLLAILLLAFVLSLFVERRAFCRYLCPIGGFTGLYSTAAPVEVRAMDSEVCRRCQTKSCYHACPWGQYPPALKSSADCGLCMECVRVCPHENIAVNLRPWGSEVKQTSRARLDEAFLGLVMLASVLVDAAVFLGPWGDLKTAAYSIGSAAWWMYSGGFLAFALLLLPGLFGLAVWAGARLKKQAASWRDRLSQASPVLVPLGLTAWMAFTVSFAFAKFGYVLPVLSDPLGWGWNLLGAIKPTGVGEITTFNRFLQVILLAGGLFWSSRTARQIYTTLREAIPMILFAALFTLTLMWLLIG